MLWWGERVANAVPWHPFYKRGRVGRVELNSGGFILIAKPESTFPNGLKDVVEEDKIIIGKIGILLGALRVDEFWSYEKPKRGNKMKQYSIHPPC